MVPKSKGVCVNWKCTLEIPGVGRRKRQSQTDPLITGIYNIFIDGTQQGALGAIDGNVVQSRQVAFQYDASATLDQRVMKELHLILSLFPSFIYLVCSNDSVVCDTI